MALALVVASVAFGCISRSVDDSIPVDDRYGLESLKSQTHIGRDMYGHLYNDRNELSLKVEIVH